MEIRMRVWIVLIIFAVAECSGEEPLGRVTDPTLQSLPRIDEQNVGLEKAVENSYKKGFGIAVIDVKQPRDFTPSLGSRGTRCKMGAESKVLLQPKYSDPWKIGHELALYPATTEKRVIVLTFSRGNWIPYSEEAEMRIRKVLEKQAKASD
jgi:hypothetical protein